VECRAVCLIEPVPGIKRQEIDFGSFWQIRRFVYDKPTFSNMCFDHHEGECNIGMAALQNAAADKPRMTKSQFAIVFPSRWSPTDEGLLETRA
jgi:hypothetical protein